MRIRKNPTIAKDQNEVVIAVAAVVSAVVYDASFNYSLT
jgi:hypothetical protein